MQKHPIKNGVLEKKTQMLKRRVLEKEEYKERVPLPHPPPPPTLPCSGGVVVVYISRGLSHVALKRRLNL